MPDYDYIITGSGCAGLSLLVRMLREPSLRDKKILLVDRAPKFSNDRTWCFWEKEQGFFEETVYRRWDHLWFHDISRSRLLPTRPYFYKMIRGIDFYRHCFHIIAQYPNVTVLYASVDYLHSEPGSTYAAIDGEKVSAEYIFNSVPLPGPATTNGAARHWRLLQHFKGWVIRALRPVFTPGEATLMDFRTGQDRGTSFFYVLPFTNTEALVECTFFSAQTMPEEEYTSRLTKYIGNILGIRDYVIQEKELGVIPMTTRTAPPNENHIRHIGMAAGLTKPSTGYTFQNIQRDSRSIVDAIVRDGAPNSRNKNSRFHFYDRVLLNVLMTEKLPGRRVFGRLFGGNALPQLFSFLDDDSTPFEDWKIIRSLPASPFAHAAVQELLGFRSLPAR